MAKISIVTHDRAAPAPPPAGVAGGETRAYLDRDKDPLHLHQYRLEAGAVLRIGPDATESILHVWEGSVSAGGHALAAGSSLVVEHGGTVALAAGEAGATLLGFAPARPRDPAAAGQVHLLPAETVPRMGDVGGPSRGAMHADATLPGCALWLHENVFAPMTEDVSSADAEKAVHAHSEDEVIFVTRGHMRLGRTLYGPGTAVAIPADTFYSFTIGPEGMSFVNFRAGRPSDIRFKDGRLMDEVGYWRDRTGSPRYLAPRAA